MVRKVLTEDTGMRWNCIRYREKKMEELINKKQINELNSKLANQLILFLIREKLKERI